MLPVAAMQWGCSALPFALAVAGILTAPLLARAALDSSASSGTCPQELVEVVEDVSIGLLRVDLLQTDIVHHLGTVEPERHAKVSDGSDRAPSSEISLVEIAAALNTSIDVTEMHFPHLGGTIGNIGRVVGQGAAEQKWHLLATALNASLGMLYKPVDELQEVCAGFRDSVVQKVIQVESNLQERRAHFEAIAVAAMNNGSAKFLSIVTLLESVQGVIPTTLKKMHMGSLATAMSSALTVIVDAAEAFQMSWDTMAPTVADLDSMAEGAVGIQLGLLDNAVDNVVAEAGNFSNTSINALSHVVDKVAASLGAPNGTFASAEQTAHGLADGLMSAVHMLAQTVTEAHSVLAPP